MPSIWIFGYGSLVHRPGFEHARRVQGYIAGFKRVWHQGSTDHRGTPGSPGRVVTLEPVPGAVTWGVAYELTGDEQQQLETMRYLEWREKQYDVRHLVDVYGDADQDGFAAPPPPVDLSHLAAAYAAPPPPVTSQTILTDAASSHDINSDATASPLQQHGAAALVNSISTPALQLATATDGDGVTTGMTSTLSMSSVDPLASSDEVSSFAPPEDWQSLSATVYLRPRNGDASATDAAGNQEEELTIAESVQPGVGVNTEEGVIPGTRLLLRNVLCYIASSDVTRNTNWLGPATLDSIAFQIAHARGPSGPNWEYVCKLAAALRQMGVDDAELFELEAKVLALRLAVVSSLTASASKRLT